MSQTATPKVTVIEAGTELRGGLKSKVPLVLRGSIEGDVVATELRIESTGSLRGSLRCTRLESHGDLGGDIGAELVVVAGKVADGTKIVAGSLEVADGPLFGNATLVIGDPPAGRATTTR
jgi:cytoskeletal protein CcmA (bactofilin family)